MDSRRQVLDILESITDGFYALDNDWRFTYINRKAEQLLNVRRENLLFRSLWQVLSKEEYPRFFSEYHLAKEQMRPVMFEEFVPLLNKWLEMHAYPYKNGMSVYIRDVTDRKRMEETLRESEQRYRMVFENSPVSIWEEDFSEVKKVLDNLRNSGVVNIERYFDHHPEVVGQCVKLVKIVDVNRAALRLHEAVSKDELKTNLAKTFTSESFKTFRNELVSLWNGVTEMVSDAEVKTIKGEVRKVEVHFSIPPGYEKTLSRVIVSLVGFTNR
jgi:PAS domain S-box-containing protein